MVPLQAKACGSVGMAVAVAWRGRARVSVRSCCRRHWTSPTTGWTCTASSFRCTPTTRRPSDSTASSVSKPKDCSVITPCVTGNGSTPW